MLVDLAKILEKKFEKIDTDVWIEVKLTDFSTILVKYTWHLKLDDS